VEREGCVRWESSVCDAAQVLRCHGVSGVFATVTGPLALGSCVQVDERHEALCGPCGWLQCRISEEGRAELWCDRGREWGGDPEPPQGGGYDCSRDKIGWIDQQRYRNPSQVRGDLELVASFYQERSQCGRPLGLEATCSGGRCRGF
jgi:hypothetical protein